MRVVRGGLLAISSAALAVSAHVLADGGLPDAAMTVLLTVLIGWTATALAAKTRGPVPTVAVLGAGQLVMHVVLSTLATHPEPHAANTGAVNGVAMTATRCSSPAPSRCCRPSSTRCGCCCRRSGVPSR
jgi:hypothetical protein